MSFSETVEFIRSVGFPMAVAGFLLWRLDDTMRKLVRSFQSLAEHLRLTREADIKELKSTVEEVGARVIREVDHNVRGALGAYAVRHRSDA
jgi:hypothetical protein